MLAQTLDADGRGSTIRISCCAFVIIINTPDPAFWQPIQDHCRALGVSASCFINAEKVKGFQAGALRIAMDAHGAADAEDFIGDPDSADYGACSTRTG